MEILLFGDPKFLKAQDLPERTVQTVARGPVVVNDIHSGADQSAFQSDGFEADLSVDRFHRCFESTAKILFAPDRNGNAVATGIRDEDKVIDIFIEHAFNAPGVPGFLSRLQYRGDDLDIDGLRISDKLETFCVPDAESPRRFEIYTRGPNELAIMGERDLAFYTQS